MATNLPRILPWIDWEEWTAIKNNIFSNCLQEQISALECVAVWRLRGKLPHSVESTAQLLEIGINDHPSGKVSYGTSIRSENELRMQYSLAIVRSVNGLVDGSQQGYFAESIYGLAASIGLPGWFVELRHDATHNQIPTLSVLRAASNRLIEWYYSNYWLPQSKYLEMVSQSCIRLPLSKYDKDDSKNETLLNSIKEQKKLRYQQSQTEQSQQQPIEDATFDILIKTSGATFITELFIPLFMNSIHHTDSTNVNYNGKNRKKMSMKNKMLKKQCDLWSARLIRIQEINKNFFTILSLHLCVSALESFSVNEVSNDHELSSFKEDASKWKVSVNQFWLDKLLTFNMDIICGVENEKIKKEFESKREQFGVLDVSSLVQMAKRRALIQVRQGFCDERNTDARGNNLNKEDCATKNISMHYNEYPIADYGNSCYKNSRDMFEAVLHKWNDLDEILKGKSENILSTTLTHSSNFFLEIVRNIQNDSNRVHLDRFGNSESMNRIDNHNVNYFDDDDNYCSNDDSYDCSDDNNSSSSSSSHKRQRIKEDRNEQNSDGISTLVTEDHSNRIYEKNNITSDAAITNFRKPCNWKLCSEFPVWPIGVLPNNSSTLNPLYLLEEMNGN